MSALWFDENLQEVFDFRLRHRWRNGPDASFLHGRAEFLRHVRHR